MAERGDTMMTANERLAPLDDPPPPRATVRRRATAGAAAVVLLLVSLWCTGLVWLMYDGARVPAGKGWIGGNYYDVSTAQAVEGLAVVAAAAAAVALGVSIANALLYWAVALERHPTRWLFVVPAIVAVLVVSTLLIFPAKL